MTATTARAGVWLRSLPDPDAVAIVAEVEDAAAALPALRPGVRVVFTGLLYRVDIGAYYVSFSPVNGAPLIVGGGRTPERGKRKGRP